MLLKIYLGISIVSLLPKAVIMTLNDINLKKDGLVLRDTKENNSEIAIHGVAVVLASTIPVINILSAYKAWNDLFHYKYQYLRYKNDLILFNKVTYKDREFTSKDAYAEFKKVQDSLFEDLDINKFSNKEEINTLIKINNLIYYLQERDVDLHDDLTALEDDEVLAYLQELVAKVKDAEDKVIESLPNDNKEEQSLKDEEINNEPQLTRRLK